MAKCGCKLLKIKSKVEFMDSVESMEFEETMDFVDSMDSVDSVDLRGIWRRSVRLSIDGTDMGLMWG